MKSPFSLIKTSLVSLLALVILLYSCGKEKSITAEQEQEMAQVSTESSGEAENTFSETFDDVMGVNNEVGLAGSGVFFGRIDTLSPAVRCFTVSVIRLTNNPFPVKVIVDFGNVGCVGPDGHKRKGKIITTYSDRLINPGATAITIFENFFIDSVHVEGTHKVSNTSEPPTIMRRYKIEVENGKLTKPNGNYVQWKSTRTVMQIEGVATTDPRDDIYKIYDGSALGKTRRGNLIVDWRSTIMEPLIRRVTCRWIVKGIIKTERLNLPGNSPWVSTLFFGTGTCDNQATLTVNNRTFQITLP